MSGSKLLFRVHAVQRMFERQISVKNIAQALQTGVTIDDYSTEMPEPSRLILAFRGKRPFHVVTSENPVTSEVTIITVYVPEPSKWNKDFTERRS